MEEITIKDYRGKIIGYIKTNPNGDKVVMDFYRKILGRYDSATDTTRDFYGRIVARGDASAMLIKDVCL